MASVIILVVLVAALAAVPAFRRRSAARGAVTAPLLDALGVPDTAKARMLLDRWGDRARVWRTCGALPTMLVAVLGGLIADRGVRLGFADGQAWTDPLLAALLGSALGAFAAELHRLRGERDDGRPRSASLAPRDLAALRPRHARWRWLVLLAACAVGATAAFVVGGAGSAWPAAVGGVVLGAELYVQHRIVARPRPALPVDLEAADDAVRGLAVRSVDDAGAGATLVLAAWSWSDVTAGLPLGDVGGVLLGLGYLMVVIVAVLWWWGSEPRRLLARTAAHGSARLRRADA